MTEKEIMEWLKKWFTDRPLSFKVYVPMRDILREIEYALERRGEEQSDDGDS